MTKKASLEKCCLSRDLTDKEFPAIQGHNEKGLRQRNSRHHGDWTDLSFLEEGYDGIT